MWLQVDNGVGFDWAIVLADADGLSYGGYDDWQAPNAKEHKYQRKAEVL